MSSSRQIDWNVVFNFKSGNASSITGLFSKLRREMESLGQISPFIQMAKDAQKYSNQISLLHKRINALNRAAAEQIRVAPGTAGAVRATIGPMKAEMIGEAGRLREKRDVIKQLDLREGEEEAKITDTAIEKVMVEALRRHDPFKAIKEIMQKSADEMSRQLELRDRLVHAGLKKEAAALNDVLNESNKFSGAADDAGTTLQTKFAIHFFLPILSLV